MFPNCVFTEIPQIDQKTKFKVNVIVGNMLLRKKIVQILQKQVCRP